MFNKELYDAMINTAINHIEKAEATLKRLEVITDFDSLEALNKYNNDLLDAKAEKDIFKILLKSLKEAEEFEEYINLW